MINLVQEAETIINNRLHEIATDVYHTMIAEAPTYTGDVMRSIDIRRMGRYWYRIAPHTDHDWYAEHGNHANHPDGYIHAKGRGMRITAPDGSVTGYRKKVRPHKGSHFVSNTAKKFR